MLRGREAGKQPLYAYIGTVDKLVHTKQILVRFYVEAGTVCKSSAHNAALKLDVILSLLHGTRIQTGRISYSMYRNRTCSQKWACYKTHPPLPPKKVSASCPLSMSLVGADLKAKQCLFVRGHCWVRQELTKRRATSKQPDENEKNMNERRRVPCFLLHVHKSWHFRLTRTFLDAKNSIPRAIW